MTETDERSAAAPVIRPLFLETSLFYPCSGVDGMPLRSFSTRFANFVYADARVPREIAREELQGRGLRGYAIEEIHDVDDHRSPALFTRLKRRPAFGDDHGLPELRLLYIRAEAIEVYERLYLSRGVVPRCLAHIRCGLGFGHNYSGYIERLSACLSTALPPWLVYDMLCEPDSGDYLPAVARYRVVEERPYANGYGQARLFLARRRGRGRT